MASSTCSTMESMNGSISVYLNKRWLYGQGMHNPVNASKLIVNQYCLSGIMRAYGSGYLTRGTEYAFELLREPTNMEIVAGTKTLENWG